MSPDKLQARLAKIKSISEDGALDVDQKINELLKLGLETFDMEIAIVSKIKNNKYTVLYCQPPEAGVEPGTVFDLGLTYCSLTIKVSMPLAIAHMSVSEHRRHPCYETFKLQSYIGTKYGHPDADYATVNFSSPQPHHEFGREDRIVIGEIARRVQVLLHAQPA